MKFYTAKNIYEMNRDNGDVDYQFKITICGDTSTGKSSFLKRYCKNEWDAVGKPTIGVEFFTNIFELDDDTKAKLQIWDTSGQERFRGMTSSYYKGAHGVIQLFDITNMESFRNLPKWVTEVKNHVSENTAMVQVGNKKDLEEKREITKEDATHYSKQNRCAYVETSCLDNKGYEIQKAMRFLVEEIMNKKGDKPMIRGMTNKAGQDNKPKEERKSIKLEDSDQDVVDTWDEDRNPREKKETRIALYQNKVKAVNLKEKKGGCGGC